LPVRVGRIGFDSVAVGCNPSRLHRFTDLLVELTVERAIEVGLAGGLNRIEFSAAFLSAKRFKFLDRRSGT
jgi:hypothetical protein